MREYRWGEDYRERMDTAIAGDLKGFFEGNEDTRLPGDMPEEAVFEGFPEIAFAERQMDAWFDGKLTPYLESLKEGALLENLAEGARMKALGVFAAAVQCMDYKHRRKLVKMRSRAKERYWSPPPEVKINRR